MEGAAGIANPESPKHDTKQLELSEIAYPEPVEGHPAG